MRTGNINAKLTGNIVGVAAPMLRRKKKRQRRRTTEFIIASTSVLILKSGMLCDTGSTKQLTLVRNAFFIQSAWRLGY
jgi:hypothetical protein